MVFLAHVTGASHWDIPKGAREKGETCLEAAVRETAEETGLHLLPQRLTELGAFSYRKNKSLHLFAAQVNGTELDLSGCKCLSLFEHPHSHRMLPEVDRFEWVPFEQMSQRCAKSMVKVLTGLLDLRALLADLPLVNPVQQYAF